ncbi:MAG: hypothetical protein M3401_05635 [Actinomycetota bacterium]|nr:hypothetical protein [Actinomycetota bacterium]
MRSRAFWPMTIAGMALSAYGLVGLLRDERVADSMSWLTFFAGGLLAHDLVWAPLVALGSVALVRIGPARVRPVLQGALIVSATVLLVAYPVVRGDGRLANNPSILPLDYPRNLVIVLVAVWAVAGVLIVRAALSQRR